jgi:ribulose-phosphate 3-epimerase
MQKGLISPSILSASFANLGSLVGALDRAGADRLHFDVMDGVFVPNITFGAKTLKDLRSLSSLPFDAHLMTLNPERHLSAFAEAGANAFTFHLEASVHAHKLCQDIRAAGLEAGVAIVPSTPAQALDALLPFLDEVLVMTVNPGWGGQKLIPECVEKVQYLRERRDRLGLGFRIAVDGGVDEKNAQGLRQAGVDCFVAGTAVVNSSDMGASIARLKALVS